MDFNLTEWLNLLVRWVHVFVGILWIGQTYLFTWLDGRFAALEAESKEKEKVWMVHSGGFYVVEREKHPPLLPRDLRWFRWEAALTWLSGMFLLVLVYYLGGVLLDPDAAEISLGTGVGIGLGVLVAGWLVYDLLAESPLGRSDAVLTVVAFLLLAGTAFGLTRVFSGRAAYMHVGALLGTLMAANVWVRILPAQRQMISAIQKGERADAALSTRAKRRSKHNTFMVLPVIFIMISNHFPVATYGHSYNWLILAGLILAGWAAARHIRRAA